MFQFEILKPFADRLEHGVTFQPFDFKEAVMADQMHGGLILEVSRKPEEIPRCDAFITQRKNLPIMVKVADCQGVLIYDPVTHSAAAVHSGWRGSTLNILGKTIQKMNEAYGSSPADLRVAISPSLGPCCSEFSDPKNELPEFCHAYIREGNRVDFWTLSVSQLREAGIPEEQIEMAGVCTKCRPGFPSHRNGDSGRMGIFVTLL